jgi:sortase A
VNEVGNLCLAGHNNYDGTMFGKVKKLELGDVINLTDLEGTIKQYTIYDKYITNPNDISITETKEFGSRELTLITCTNGNKERLIIKAREI